MVDVKSYTNINKNGTWIVGPMIGKLCKIAIHLEKAAPEAYVRIFSEDGEELANDYFNSQITRFIPLDYNENFPEMTQHFYIAGKVRIEMGGLAEDNIVKLIRFYLD